MRRILFIPIIAFALSCSEPKTDQQVAELEREVAELRSQLEQEKSQQEAASTSQSNQNDDESYDLLRGLLDDEPPNLAAEITDREFKTDANFDNYTDLTVINNYSKTIRSIRVGSRLMDSFDRPDTPAWRNSRKEIVHITIRPGQSRTFAVRNLRGLPQDFYIDGITFTDGTARN